MVTSTQKPQGAEVLVVNSSSPVKERYLPRKLNRDTFVVSSTPPLPLASKSLSSTKALDDIVNMGIFTDSDDDIVIHPTSARLNTDERPLKQLKSLSSEKVPFDPSNAKKLFDLPPLFVADDETNDSIVNSSFNVFESAPSIPPAKPSRERPSRYRENDDDDDLMISEHNVILSSSPIGPDYHSDNEPANCIFASKSEVERPRSVAIFGGISETITKGKKEESAITQSLNPFLNSFLKSDTENRQNLEKLRRNFQSDSNTAILQAISRSLTEPIITEHEVRPEPGQRNATRSVESTKVRTTKEQRDQIKHQKEKARRTKRLYQELNKSKRTKDELLSEMMLEIPADIISILKSIEYKQDLEPIHIKEVSTSPLSKEVAIKWSRKSNSRYIPETDTFESADFHLIHEEEICYVFTAKNFVDAIENDELIEKFKNIKMNTQKSKNILLLIIGLDALFLRLKNLENREFQERVRSGLSEDSLPNSVTEEVPTTKKQKKKTSKETTTTLGIKEIESGILKLQINGIKVFPTKNVHETVQWLRSFTYTIASARYDKFERNQDLAHIGAVRSGTDVKDTYSKMLQHFKLMTTLKAEKIIDEFPTVYNLYKSINGGHPMTDNNGRKIVNGNIEIGLKKLFTTYDENELLKEN